jgi:hypothetical protein
MYPKQILTGFSSVGGIYGFLKILTIIFEYIHQKQFEKTLKDEHERIYKSEENLLTTGNFKSSN